MAIAHVCLGCGFDLARVRAGADPHYGLPLIICPQCTTATIRRKHPLQKGFRFCLRLDWTLFILVAQVLALLFMLGMTMGGHRPPADGADVSIHVR